MTASQTRDVALLEREWPDGHAALVRALLDPQCYPHPVGSVEHIETHISDLLLTGRYAYKLKKPLDLGFLDFSTLADRRFFCLEELRLNRRLAPDLYLDVVAITGTRSHPKIGAEGDPIEYAVRMRQFDQNGMLDRALARGELTTAHVDEIARSVAAFHAGLPAAPPESAFGTADSVMQPALQNFDQLQPLIDRDADRALLRELNAWTRAQHETLASLFELRRRDGFVRECHGDLHLANMVLIDGRVRIFDCIEFNPQLRWIDVANEAAFLAMDLLQRQRADLAWRFLNRYLEITGDYPGVRLLRYYMVYRAMVRAKVAALRAAQGDVGRSARQSLEAKCRAHLMLAQHLTTTAEPALLILHGLAGSGKTTVSQTIVEHVGAIRVRSDLERKRLHGLAEAARSDSEVGSGIYTPSSDTATYKRLADLAQEVVRGGFTVLVDATFLAGIKREQFRSLAAKLGCPFAILHVEAAESVLRERVARRAAAGTDASEANLAVLDRQRASQDPLSVEERSWTETFHTDHLDRAVIARQARGLMQRLGSGII